MINHMEETKKILIERGFKGDFDTSPESLEKFSHDASMFEIVPKLIVAPKDASDVERLVKYVADAKKSDPSLSLTARSAGTDMTGGAINDSIIIDFQKYFNNIGEIGQETARTQPGVFFRDFDATAKEKGVLMPTYPASRDLASVGGMVNNNSGGEKSIEFGNTENFINELKFVFADGVERVVKPLNEAQLAAKMGQGDFEGQVYRELYELIDKNYDMIKAAKPKVSKNSTGYLLWNVYDRETGIFDLTQLIAGSQGTLGMVTEIEFKVIQAREQEGLLVMFLKSLDGLPDLINTVVAIHSFHAKFLKTPWPVAIYSSFD